MSANSTALFAQMRDEKDPGTTVAGASETLVHLIPTEALASYTAFVGIFLATTYKSKGGSIPIGYGMTRWGVFGAFVLLALLLPVAMFAGRERTRRATGARREARRFPFAEPLTGAFAAAAWGLVMPGTPLGISVKGDALVVTTAVIIFGSTAVLALTANFLGTANDKNDSSKGGDAKDILKSNAVFTSPMTVIPTPHPWGRRARGLAGSQAHRYR